MVIQDGRSNGGFPEFRDFMQHTCNPFLFCGAWISADFDGWKPAQLVTRRKYEKANQLGLPGSRFLQ